MTLRARETREALMDVAERRFAESGFDGVGIRQLAAEAGCNLAAIRYHFGSKRELYLETVRRAMERSGSGSTWAILDERPADRRAAARLLGLFVTAFLEQLCADAEGDACVRLMLREAMRPSEAIDSVVSRYTRPRQDLLVSVVACIAPELDRRARELAVHSLLGQVLHYPIQRAFLARQSSVEPNEPAARAAIARHVTAFTLRGLGCSARFVERALDDLNPQATARTAGGQRRR